MNIKESDEKLEQWRKEQIASLIRTGHLEAAKAFEQLGSIHWMAWQSAWALSRESLVIELPVPGEPFVVGGITSWSLYNQGRNGVIKEIQQSIEAAGLKVKS